MYSTYFVCPLFYPNDGHQCSQQNYYFPLRNSNFDAGLVYADVRNCTIVMTPCVEGTWAGRSV